MAVIKKGKVKRSGYRDERNSGKLVSLIAKCMAAGKGAVLYKDPHILALFYSDGNDAKEALETAKSDYKNRTNGGSILIIEGKMALVVIWIDSYADQVEVIANDPANRTTQEEAVANIGLSGLPAQKIGKNTKGKPAQPVLTGEYFTGGIIKVKLTNGKAYQFTSITYIAVSVPPASEPAVAPAKVTLTGDQLSVLCAAAVHVMTKTIKGKSKSTKFTGAISLLGYNIYAITQNGAKLVSDISAVITVNP